MSLDTTRRLLAGLIDDAALFPPGNAPMAAAVPAHDAHERSWYGPFIGPFLCPDVRLAELVDALGGRDADVGPLRVIVIVTGGAAAVGEAVGTVKDEPRLALAGVEVPPTGNGEGIEAARQAVVRLTAEVPADVPAFLEVARGPAAEGVLDVLAGTRVRAKLRTGGTSAAAFPGEREVADFMLQCLRREVAFKCTAGLHHAVRHTARDLGFEHHGFLNVLLAVEAALAGGSVDDVAAVLAQRDEVGVAEGVKRLTGEQVTAIRRWFASYGTCDVGEPLDGIVGLGLLPAGRLGSATQPEGDPT